MSLLTTTIYIGLNVTGVFLVAWFASLFYDNPLIDKDELNYALTSSFVLTAFLLYIFFIANV